MTRKEIIYDLKRLLTKAGITDESRLNNNHLGFLVDQRRAKEIRDSFKRNPVIEPIWLQDYGIFNLSIVNKAEDRSVAICDCKFSKAVLPAVVSIVDSMSNTPDIGTYSIRSVCGQYLFHYMNSEKMTLLTPTNILGKLKHYTKIGNAVYLTPEVLKARAVLILDSPLDGYVLDNIDIPTGSLVVGTSYEVESGTIVHNSRTYRKGETFTAVNANFTGNGKVRYENQKRRMTNDDPYPMSHTMLEVIKIKILIQDFGIEQRAVADIVNDSQDEAKELS